MTVPWPALISFLFLQDAGSGEEPRGLRFHREGAHPGYTLFTPAGSGVTHLVDMEGREVHRWTSALGASSVYLLDDGSILRAGRIEKNPVFDGGGICGRIERIGWDGEIQWFYELANEDQTQHHDALPMPNGKVLLITWEFRYREDCIAAGRDPAKSNDKGLWPDAVLEVKPTLPSGGEVVWEWHAWDHLVQDFDPSASNHGRIGDQPGRIDVNYDHRDVAPLTDEELARRAALAEEMRALGYTGGEEEEDEAAGAPAAPATPTTGNMPDWMHTNAIDYSPELDLILLSSPNLSEIWIVDHSTTSDQAAGSSGGRRGKGGDILWRWGNPKNHAAGTAADQRLFYQHNAQWIRAGLPGAGHLLVFNNGQTRPGGEYSTVEELELPPFDAKGGFVRSGDRYGPTEPVWVHGRAESERFFASFISGCQRLPNGNTLICEGPRGRVFEVTTGGEIVWEFWNPWGGDLQIQGVDSKALFRATRVPNDHPGLAGRELAPRELEPATR